MHGIIVRDIHEFQIAAFSLFRDVVVHPRGKGPLIRSRLCGTTFSPWEKEKVILR